MNIKSTHFSYILSLCILVICIIFGGCGSNAPGKSDARTSTVSGKVIDNYNLLSLGYELLIKSYSSKTAYNSPSGKESSDINANDLIVTVDADGNFSVELDEGTYGIYLQDNDLLLYLDIFTCFQNTPLHIGDIVLPDPGLSTSDDDTGDDDNGDDDSGDDDTGDDDGGDDDTGDDDTGDDDTGDDDSGDDDGGDDDTGDDDSGDDDTGDDDSGDDDTGDDDSGDDDGGDDDSGDDDTGDDDNIQTTLFSGTVLDANGEPLEGAVIELSNSLDKALSDIHGYFSLEINVGQHQMHIRKGAEEIYSMTLFCFNNKPFTMNSIVTSYNPENYDNEVLIICPLSHENASECNFTTDGDGGDDDNLIIQEAIDSLPESGGEVKLLEGEYFLNGSASVYALYIRKSNIVLSGAGDATHLKADSAASDIIAGINVTGQNVTLRNFFIDGTDGIIDYQIIFNGSHVYGGGRYGIASGLTVCCAGTDGIVVDGADDVIVENNYLYDIYRNEGGDRSSALEVEDFADRTLVKNNIVDNSRTCMFPHTHDNIKFAVITDIMFVGNTCRRGQKTDAGALAIFNGENSNVTNTVTFKNNTILDTKGIFIGAGNKNATYKAEITDNTIKNSKGYGILCANTDDEGYTHECTIKRNSLYNSRGKAIDVCNSESHNIIEDNLIAGATGSGIALRCNALEHTGGVISGNHIEDVSPQEHSIKVSDTSGTVSVTGNRFSGSSILVYAGHFSPTLSIRGNTGINAGITGYVLDGRPITTISENTLYDCPDYYCISSIGESLIEWNTVKYGGSNGAINARHNHSVVRHNTVVSPASNGIVIYGDDIEARHNTIHDAGQDNDSSSGVVVYGNHDIIENNEILDSRSINPKTLFGIHLTESADGAVIRNNTISGVSSDAIYLESGTGSEDAHDIQ